MKLAWLQLKRLVGIMPNPPAVDQEGQLRYVRNGATKGHLYVARMKADGTMEWVDLTP